MRNSIFIFYGYVFTLVLFQLLVVRHLSIFSLGQPFPYLGVLLFLPLVLNQAWLMLIAFFVGLIIDIVYNTLGIHTAACVLVAGIRPQVLGLLSPSGGYEVNSIPDYTSFGIGWYIAYLGISILAHHLLLFILYKGVSGGIFNLIFTVIMSTIFTLIMIWGLRYFLLINYNKR